MHSEYRDLRLSSNACNQGSELDIDHSDIQAVKIAGNDLFVMLYLVSFIIHLNLYPFSHFICRIAA